MATGPLAGVKVIELAGLGPAPFAAMMLADLGAEVLRIDRPGTPDFPIDPELDVLRRNHESVTLDLRSPGGIEQVLTMVEHADVLIEGLRPGVTERLGIGPEACHARNPRLVYGRMTGWGQTGPLAHTAGHDLTYLAITGALDSIGRAGGPPVIPVNYVGDFGGGGMYLVTGVLAAVIHARSTGEGQVVDAAIVDGVASLTAFTQSMRAMGLGGGPRGTNLLDGGVPWYDVYAAADGRWVAVAPLEPKFFAEFCRLLPLEATEADRADRSRWPVLREAIAARIAERTRDEWAALFADTDACVAPVLSFEESRRYPHLVARGTWTDVGGVQHPSPAPRFSRPLQQG